MKTRLMAAALLAACAGCSNIDIALRGGDIGQSHAPKQSRQPASYDVQQAEYAMPAGESGGMVQQAMLMEQPGTPGQVMVVQYPANCPNCYPGGYGGGYGHHAYPGGPFHGGRYGYFGGAHRTPGYPHHHFSRSYVGPQGPPTAQVAYPYYTTRGPRDFLLDNPPSIGR